MKTLQQVITERGINEQKAVSSLNRSRSTQARKDRKKIYPAFIGPMTDEQRRLRDIMRDSTITQTYVLAWCKANHLTV